MCFILYIFFYLESVFDVVLFVAYLRCWWHSVIDCCYSDHETRFSDGFISHRLDSVNPHNVTRVPTSCSVCLCIQWYSVSSGNCTTVRCHSNGSWTADWTTNDARWVLQYSFYQHLFNHFNDENVIFFYFCVVLITPYYTFYHIILISYHCTIILCLVFCFFSVTPSLAMCPEMSYSELS